MAKQKRPTPASSQAPAVQQQNGTPTTEVAPVTASSSQNSTPAVVPRTEEEVLSAIRARHGDVIAELEERPKKADDRLTPYLKKFEAMTPGAGGDDARQLWKDFLKEYGAVSKESGDTSGGDVRSLYDNEFVQAMDEWNAALETANEPIQTRAELAHLYRRTLRELSRDLMQDTEAVAVLRARDMVVHGHPDGPAFDDLVEKNMAKPEVSTKDQAYQAIIGSSTTHNKEASDAARRTRSGGSG